MTLGACLVLPALDSTTFISISAAAVQSGRSSILYSSGWTAAPPLVVKRTVSSHVQLAVSAQPSAVKVTMFLSSSSDLRLRRGNMLALGHAQVLVIKQTFMQTVVRLILL